MKYLYFVTLSALTMTLSPTLRKEDTLSFNNFPVITSDRLMFHISFPIGSTKNTGGL